MRVDERLEAIGVSPRRVSALELVADEPEAVEGLEVVAGRRLAFTVGAVCDEGAPEGADGRPRRDEGSDRVERYDESERAASTSSSKSGTSVVS